MGLFNRKKKEPEGFENWEKHDQNEWRYQNGVITKEEYEKKKEFIEFINNQRERQSKENERRELDDNPNWHEMGISGLDKMKWKIEFANDPEHMQIDSEMFRITCYKIDVKTFDAYMAKIIEEVKKRYKEETKPWIDWGKEDFQGKIPLGLSQKNLRGENFTGQDLSGAKLSGADLEGVDLMDANLCGADLSGAKLSGANLGGADLRATKLSGVDLKSVNLSGVDFRQADLSGKDLSGVNLTDADLSGADLSRANLTNANLSGVKLYGANLSDAVLIDANLSREDLSDANTDGCTGL